MNYLFPRNYFPFRISQIWNLLGTRIYSFFLEHSSFGCEALYTLI